MADGEGYGHDEARPFDGRDAHAISKYVVSGLPADIAALSLPPDATWIDRWRRRLASVPTVRLLLGFFLLNFLLRLVLILPAKPYSPPHDGCHYMLLGRALARGEGYVNRVVYAPRFVGQGRYCDAIPYPDFQRPPLYPFLLSLAYRALGESYFAAQLVNVLLGACIPVLTYLFALRLLSGTAWEASARSVAFSAAVFTTLSGVLAAYTSETMLEFSFLVFVLLFLLAFLAGTRTRRPGWAIASGFLWGLAWYARHEAIYVLAVPVAVEILLVFGVVRGIPLFLGTLGAAVATVAPWHIRAWRLTGNPWHSDLKHHLMAAYADFHEYFCEWTPLPETSLPAFFLADPLAVAARYLRLLYELVTQIPLSVMDGVVLAFLAGVGLCAARTAWRRWLPFGLWIAANLGFFAFTFSLARFLYVLIPLLAILAALGLHIVEPRLAPASSRAAVAWTIGSTVLWTAWFLVAQSRTAVAKVGGVSLAVAFFLLLFLLGCHLRQGTFLRLSRRFVLPFLLANLVIGFMVGILAGVREHRKERYPGAWIARLQAFAAPGETIMVYRKPYFYGWILDRDIVQMPIEREKKRGESEEAYAAYRREYRAYLADLLARFRVAWIVNKGRKRKGATPPGESSVIYTHGWPPGGEPLPAIRYRESHAFGNTVYDVYRVTAPARERDTLAGARRVPEG